MFLKKKKTVNTHLSDKNLIKTLNKRKFPSLKQIKHIGKFLKPVEKFLLYFSIILILISSFWLAFVFYNSHSIEVAKSGGVFTEAFIKNPVYINPVLLTKNSVDEDISRLIYSSLLKYDKDLNLVPDIADKYTISDDGKIYTFHIKDSIKFHDGEKLTVDDVVFTYSLIQNPEYKSPLYTDFSSVKIDKIDEHTIQFVLNDPYAPFINLFTVGILPMHIWENVNPSNFTLAQYNIKPIGSGPYKFDKFFKDINGNIVSYDLVKNEDYYSTLPYINNINFKFYADSQPAIDALIKGDVDAFGDISYKELDYISTEDNINIYDLSLSQYTALFFNMKNNKYLKEKYIRQALSLSLDKSKILRELFGDGVNIINAPIGKHFLEDIDESNQFDFEKAKQLFVDNKWVLDDKGKLTKKSEDKDEKESENIKLTITVVNKDDSLAIATFVKDTWNQLGLDVDLKVVDNSEIKTIIKDRDYDVLLYGESLGNDPDLFPFWHSTQVEYPGLNLAQLENKKIDTLIEESRQILDFNSRLEKYKELNKLISDEYPAIFLYSPKYIYAINTKVHNYNMSKIYTYADRWNDFSSLYIKTKKEFQLEK